MRVLITALVLAAFGCDSTSAPDDRWAVPENITYAASLGIDLEQMSRTESGLYWQDLEMGMGDRVVEEEDEVAYHLTIWLPDGREVFTTRKAAPEVGPVLLLFPGLAEGVLGMRPGGVRKLVIRPELAFPNGRNDFEIPPITTIICEVELVSIH